jgi:excisionase family DNA binding protein
MPEPERHVLTPNEAAEYLGVTRQTIYALIQRGEIRKYKVARCTRIPKSDLDALIGGEPTGDPQ